MSGKTTICVFLVHSVHDYIFCPELYILILSVLTVSHRVLSSHTITMTTAHGTQNLKFMRVLTTALLLLAQEAQGLYLPGVDPNSFADGEA